MGYGLKVTGVDTAGGDFYVIDSDTSSTESLGIKTGGVYISASNDNRASIAANTAFSNYTSASGNFLFARSDTTGEAWFSDYTTKLAGSFVVGKKHVVSQVGTTTNWTQAVGTANPSRGDVFTVLHVGSGNGEMMLQETTAAQAMKYAVLHPISTITTNVNGSNYGIQIKNAASPSRVILDSRKIDKTIKIHKICDKNAFVGGKWSEMTTAQKAASLVWDGSSQSTVEWKNTYVTILGAFNTADTASVFRMGGFYFDNSNKKIYHLGYLQVTYSGDYTAYPNACTILVGELIQ